MLLLLTALLALSTTIFAAQDCNKLGFTGEQVCSDCDVLAQYVKDAELVDDCKKCCVKDAVSAKYTKAELLIDQWRVGALPQIKDFIDKRSKSYGSSLKVLYTHGGAPRLRLSGPSGTETIRIDNWKAANIVEFLEERLERSGVGSSASGKGAIA